MKTVSTAVLLLACAGCSLPQISSNRVTPTRAILYTDTVNVIMSEGSLCAGERPGRAVEWTGQLMGCAFPLTYSVQMPNALSRPRIVLQKLTDAGPANATLSVIDSAGAHHVFSAP